MNSNFSEVVCGLMLPRGLLVSDDFIELAKGSDHDLLECLIDARMDRGAFYPWSSLSSKQGSIGGSLLLVLWVMFIFSAARAVSGLMSWCGKPSVEWADVKAHDRKEFIRRAPGASGAYEAYFGARSILAAFFLLMLFVFWDEGAIFEFAVVQKNHVLLFLLLGGVALVMSAVCAMVYYWYVLRRIDAYVGFIEGTVRGILQADEAERDVHAYEVHELADAQAREVTSLYRVISSTLDVLALSAFAVSAEYFESMAMAALCIVGVVLLVVARVIWCMAPAEETFYHSFAWTVGGGLVNLVTSIEATAYALAAVGATVAVAADDTGSSWAAHVASSVDSAGTVAWFILAVSAMLLFIAFAAIALSYGCRARRSAAQEDDVVSAASSKRHSGARRRDQRGGAAYGAAPSAPPEETAEPEGSGAAVRRRAAGGAAMSAEDLRHLIERAKQAGGRDANYYGTLDGSAVDERY
jgi:hypothetical protein